MPNYKPTKCTDPYKQFLNERRKFLRRMKPKPVLAEKIKSREAKQLEENEKRSHLDF